VVQNQGFVQMPPPIPNCPPGLEYLASIDQMIIKQKKELFESKIRSEIICFISVENVMLIIIL
jgi:hypothetical protein